MPRFNETTLDVISRAVHDRVPEDAIESEPPAGATLELVHDLLGQPTKISLAEHRDRAPRRDSGVAVIGELPTGAEPSQSTLEKAAEQLGENWPTSLSKESENRKTAADGGSR